jgi:hypothetical protein
MMGRRQKIKSGMEVDVLEHRKHCRSIREVKCVKRALNKRERKEAKDTIRSNAEMNRVS